MLRLNTYTKLEVFLSKLPFLYYIFLQLTLYFERLVSFPVSHFLCLLLKTTNIYKHKTRTHNFIEFFNIYFTQKYELLILSPKFLLLKSS